MSGKPRASSGADSNELSRFDVCKQARNQRAKRFETVILGDEHHHSDRKLRQVLLELEAPITGDPYVEIRRGSAKQLSVLQTRPALLLDALHIVSRQF